MRKKLLMIVFVVLLGFISSGENKKVAIYGFESNTFRENNMTGYTIVLESAFFDIENITIVDRNSLEKIIEEQKLSMAGVTENQKKAIELGKMAGADYITIGTLNNTPSGYIVNVRVLDIEEGTVVFSQVENAVDLTRLDRVIKDIVSNIVVDNGRITKYSKLVKENKAGQIRTKSNEKELRIVDFDGSRINISTVGFSDPGKWLSGIKGGVDFKSEILPDNKVEANLLIRRFEKENWTCHVADIELKVKNDIKEVGGSYIALATDIIYVYGEGREWKYDGYYANGYYNTYNYSVDKKSTSWNMAVGAEIGYDYVKTNKVKIGSSAKIYYILPVSGGNDTGFIRTQGDLNYIQWVCNKFCV